MVSGLNMLYMMQINMQYGFVSFILFKINPIAITHFRSSSWDQIKHVMEIMQTKYQDMLLCQWYDDKMSRNDIE